MEKYQQTTTWKNTLGKVDSPDQEAIDRLKNSFVSFREKVKHLAGEIVRYLPEFTVHDITHIDALWEMADCICGDDYELNPVEGYILGGSFLLHDLAMSLAAYPNGVKDLEELPLWSDTIVQYCKRYNLDLPKSYSYDSLTTELKNHTVSTLLRKLHATSAEKLASVAWKSSSGDVFLIDNPEERGNFGKLIGKIAHSHWWDISKVESEFSRTIGSPAWCPRDWTIDPLKIAAILRVADASHIDSRRAPMFLRTLRKLNAHSDQHWSFQEKLAKPYLQEDSLVYTSGYHFEKADAPAWWLCYESLTMIDNELRQVDALLADKGMNRFKARRVSSIESPERLSQNIFTEGWSPIDAFVHIGDLPKIIKNFGGEELYGKNYKVPLREMIQNANDAINARVAMEERDNSWGQITVSLIEENDKTYVQVEDNGIGMSLNVIKQYLFDFGSSYWGSELMLEEHPDLMSKTVEHTGKYGIGFFSTFMYGDEVTITTRKSNSGITDTKVIEFKSGLNNRPIIREAEKHELLIDGGTKIKVRIEDKNILESFFEEDMDFYKTCISIAPCLNVDMLIKYNGTEKKFLRDTWKNCTENEFIDLLNVLNSEKYNNFYSCTYEAATKVRTIQDESGDIIARGYMPYGKFMDSTGYLVVGGLVEDTSRGLIGIFQAKNVNAARNRTKIIASLDQLRDWVNVQTQLAQEDSCYGKLNSLDYKIKLNTIRLLKSDIGKFKIIECNGESLSYGETVEMLKANDEIVICPDYFTSYQVNDIRGEIEYTPNVIFVSHNAYFNVGKQFDLNESNEYETHIEDYSMYRETVFGFLIDALIEAWGGDLRHYLNELSEDVVRKRGLTTIVARAGEVEFKEDVIAKLKRESIL